jgi:hypothetical protein
MIFQRIPGVARKIEVGSRKGKIVKGSINSLGWNIGLNMAFLFG